MNIEAIKSYKFAPIIQEYDFKDLIIYGLGLGYGSNPLDENELKFVFEDNLEIVPSFCNSIAHAGFWIMDEKLNLDWKNSLHGEQYYEIHKIMPLKGKVRAEHNIISVEDKGHNRGAIITAQKKLYDVMSGDLYATLLQSLFFKNEGGQGGFGKIDIKPQSIPQNIPDYSIEIKTPLQLALIYRLSGDYEKIHASPKAANAVGFEKPILHGLCTLGIATRAIIALCCNHDPSRLKSMFARFSKPVFPGETLKFEIYKQGNEFSFRCISIERNIVVLDKGFAKII